MMGRVLQWAATRAATGWALALGLSVASALWFLFEQRGDEIAELKLQLSECRVGAKQAELIEALAKRLNEQAQEKGDDEVKRIEDLPNECFFLDDPSPLSRVREPAD